jgi:hypothetical protein
LWFKGRDRRLNVSESRMLGEQGEMASGNALKRCHGGNIQIISPTGVHLNLGWLGGESN